MYQRKAALAAGTVLMIMALAAFFSYGFVWGSLVIEGDKGATFHNLQASPGLFRAGIAGWLITLICDIVAAWGLYIFFKPIHWQLSLLGAWLRLVYAGILGAAIMNLMFAAALAGKAGGFSSFNLEQLQALTALFLKNFHLMWSVGLIVFGGHLLIIGFMAFKTEAVPKVIGILLLIAAAGYTIIHSGYAFLPQFNKAISMLEAILSVPMSLGEFSLGIWLLLRGGKLPKSG
ncbi:DUF4386 domain-containing protein [Ectobacillus ponti]|uniref:DUF4386 domain-containing protein n=1 Tax=Ectobacillus ponti TaxID=2961894 RepID=A0AA41X998_9BACI|nr:DUF4386 domain-containing protein [Ectobacillus ponti]MCP8969513.1 DUF4386 domain-containing protein [Ectobacillus ponti]